MSSEEPKREPDGGLLERAREGDLPAFQTLVETHSRDVFRLAFRITGNEADADDAVQETFLKVFRKLRTFEARSQFRTWLYRVTANTAIEVVRRRQRDRGRTTPLESDEPGGFEAVSELPGQDRLVYGNQVRDRVQAALQELTPMERTAFVLRHYEDCPLSEIGRTMGLKTSATKQAVFRAVKKLRKTLEPVVRSAS